MKSRYITIISEADSSRCKQTGSACNYGQSLNVEDIKTSFNSARQLYATEAEDYFFYFIPGAFDGVVTQTRN